MTHQNLLEKALRIAIRAHGNQKDKAGRPYILHPLRVMLLLKTQESKITALLHDVVEDSDFTMVQIKKMGFSKNITKAVEYLSRKKEQPYEEYIKSLKKYKLARIVKLADLADNLDQSRLLPMNTNNRTRIIKYRKAVKLLKKA